MNLWIAYGLLWHMRCELACGRDAMKVLLGCDVVMRLAFVRAVEEAGGWRRVLQAPVPDDEVCEPVVEAFDRERISLDALHQATAVKQDFWDSISTALAAMPPWRDDWHDAPPQPGLVN